ncbi:uncharacterized protein CLUP02_08047 [Colletotrichum lupini]|uniref:Uncharacterized protein n=1 Tax=Colletotrichum lupini TaxID=145971 RepID=A0A9Q8SSC4_9PEZI|nr:uncharacterized protein CLUP02_08047 [Colletotrichum lupini]UQC82558.1 hypothetical protein CLUP02_08047 [Colletotrichum lupini]
MRFMRLSDHFSSGGEMESPPPVQYRCTMYVRIGTLACNVPTFPDVFLLLENGYRRPAGTVKVYVRLTHPYHSATDTASLFYDTTYLSLSYAALHVKANFRIRTPSARFQGSRGPEEGEVSKKRKRAPVKGSSSASEPNFGLHHDPSIVHYPYSARGKPFTPGLNPWNLFDFLSAHIQGFHDSTTGACLPSIQRTFTRHLIQKPRSRLGGPGAGPEPALLLNDGMPKNNSRFLSQSQIPISISPTTTSYNDRSTARKSTASSPIRLFPSPVSVSDLTLAPLHIMAQASETMSYKPAGRTGRNQIIVPLFSGSGSFKVGSDQLSKSGWNPLFSLPFLITIPHLPIPLTWQDPSTTLVFRAYPSPPRTVPMQKNQQNSNCKYSVQGGRESKDAKKKMRWKKMQKSNRSLPQDPAGSKPRSRMYRDETNSEGEKEIKKERHRIALHVVSAFVQHREIGLSTEGCRGATAYCVHTCFRICVLRYFLHHQQELAVVVVVSTTGVWFRLTGPTTRFRSSLVRSRFRSNDFLFAKN